MILTHLGDATLLRARHDPSDEAFVDAELLVGMVRQQAARQVLGRSAADTLRAALLQQRGKAAAAAKLARKALTLARERSLVLDEARALDVLARVSPGDEAVERGQELRALLLEHGLERRLREQSAEG